MKEVLAKYPVSPDCNVYEMLDVPTEKKYFVAKTQKGKQFHITYLPSNNFAYSLIRAARKRSRERQDVC